MNWKLAILGGLVFYAATWLVSMVNGPLIHEGVLLESYKATAGFWRPELMQEPPDMAALLPRWIATGLVGAFILGALYGFVHPALSGPGVLRGLKFGLGVFLICGSVMAGWSGVFNLPDRIWWWWALDALAMYLAGGAAMGWAADRWWLRPKAG